jgi:hypothetical protein
MEDDAAGRARRQARVRRSTLPLDNTPIEAKLLHVTKFLPLLFALTLPLTARTATLPSRDPQVVLPLLERWHEHKGFFQLEHILGRADSQTISGFAISVFALRDGTSLYVSSTPSHNRIFTIRRSAPGRLAETLYEPLAGDLDQPLPASAPY